MSNTKLTKKTGDEPRCSGTISNRSCSISGIRRVNSYYTHGETTGLWLRQAEYIHDHLWCIFSVAVTQDMVATVKYYKWFHQHTSWYISWLVSSNLLSGLIHLLFLFSWCLSLLVSYFSKYFISTFNSMLFGNWTFHYYLNYEVILFLNWFLYLKKIYFIYLFKNFQKSILWPPYLYNSSWVTIVCSLISEQAKN